MAEKTRNITLRLSEAEIEFLKREGRSMAAQFRADMRFIRQFESLLSGGLGKDPAGRVYQMAKGEIIEESQD